MNDFNNLPARILRGVTRTVRLVILDGSGNPVDLSQATSIILTVAPDAGGNSVTFKPEFSIGGASNNVLSFAWYADMQQRAGRYTFTVVADYGDRNIAKVNWHGPTGIELVEYNVDESGTLPDNVEIDNYIELTGSVTMNGVGMSAYEFWLAEGHDGSVADFLAWLQQPAEDAATDVEARMNTVQDRADEDHTRAEQDHTTAGTDHALAESDHTRAETDHQRAETDHTTAGADHSTAGADHTQAASDHQRAETDHTTAGTDHAQAESDHSRAETDHTASADATLAATEAARVATAAAEAATSLQTSLESGEVVPALAGDIASWKGNNSPVEDTWSDVIRPTAGSVSIVTAAGGKIKSIIAKSLIFSATAMRAEGFNRLHYATALGAGYYFLVPALPFGTFGTAIEPNGILFTNSAGQNLRPTVRFKKLTDGVPTSLSDGAACTYVDSNTYRFYTCSEPGYMIVSGITFADTCAHIAWSSRYDEFVSPTASADAGTVVSLTALLNAVHSYGQLLCVGDRADGIVWTDDTHYSWTRNNDRITPTWSTVANEDGTYTHIATISTMLSDGAAVLADGTPLAVEGTTVSYTDDSADAVTGYVYFNLATPATGTGTASRNAAMEDWGVEAVIGATGEAYITTMYYRGMADTVRAWVAGEMDGAFAVIAQLFADADRRMASIEDRLADGMLSLTVDNLTVNNSLTRYDNSGNRILTGEGAPAAMADHESQLYKDTASGDWYFATGTTAVSQWRKITLQ